MGEASLLVALAWGRGVAAGEGDLISLRLPLAAAVAFLTMMAKRSERKREKERERERERERKGWWWWWWCVCVWGGGLECWGGGLVAERKEEQTRMEVECFSFPTPSSPLTCLNTGRDGHIYNYPRLVALECRVTQEDILFRRGVGKLAFELRG